MQAELAHHHHQQQQQQRSNMNQNHYVTVSIPYHVPQQSTTSNYHLSDPNAIGTESNDIIDIYGSDSAPSSSVPSSAASSLVHLPLAGGVSTNTTMDGISTRRESLIGYDNVRFSFFASVCGKNCAYIFLCDCTVFFLSDNGICY